MFYRLWINPEVENTYESFTQGIYFIKRQYIYMSSEMTSVFSPSLSITVSERLIIQKNLLFSPWLLTQPWSCIIVNVIIFQYLTCSFLFIFWFCCPLTELCFFETSNLTFVMLWLLSCKLRKLTTYLIFFCLLFQMPCAAQSHDFQYQLSLGIYRILMSQVLNNSCET